jgi:bifunctional DNA-binding transcriptional regulator/antitoxin component of YhaV-PrlF toxin-antitoxin module
MAPAVRARAGDALAAVVGRLTARWRDASDRGLPKDVRERLALDKGERVLTIVRDPADACALVATERALYHRDGKNDWRRQGWERVSAVDWDAARRRLVCTGLNDAGLGPQRNDVAVGDRGDVVELASERITHTRLGRWPLMLPGGEPAEVEARRRPATGELLWLVHLDGICWDIRDRAVHASVSRAIARLGADLGMHAVDPAC